MKKIILLFALVAFIACKDDKKSEKDTTKDTTPEVEKVEEEVNLNYPEIQKYNEEFRFIHEGLHSYDDVISTEEVAMVSTSEKDVYDFIFYLSDDTNLEDLKNYNLALILYPDALKDNDKKKQSIVKSVGAGNIVRDGKSLAILLKGYKVDYKKILSGKAYLYYKGKGGVLNPGRPKLIIEEFSL